MRAFKKTILIHNLFNLTFLIFMFLTCCADSEDSLTTINNNNNYGNCGKIPIHEPLNHMLLCRSQKLFLRTSIGLFPISSVNYTTRLFTIISQPSSCSHSLHYVSPSLLSAGLFPKKPTQPNSLLLFNCTTDHHQYQNHYKLLSPFLRNHTCPHTCDELASRSQVVVGQQVIATNINTSHFSNCFYVDDIEKLDINTNHVMGFHPRDLNCSHYRRVYNDDEFGGVELGTRISFDVPDHVPNVCNECEKPDGNCGVALRCICHPKECKNKVISKSTESKRAFGNNVIILVSVLVVIVV